MKDSFPKSISTVKCCVIVVCVYSVCTISAVFVLISSQRIGRLGRRAEEADARLVRRRDAGAARGLGRAVD